MNKQEAGAENVEDMSEYGYDNPVYTVTFKTSDKEYTVHIGDYNSVISRYYVMNGNTVYALTISQRSTLHKEKEYFEKTEE